MKNHKLKRLASAPAWPDRALGTYLKNSRGDIFLTPLEALAALDGFGIEVLEMPATPRRIRDLIRARAGEVR